MKYKNMILPTIALLSACLAHAGLDSTTVHSRANCLNNESITWWYLHPYNWRVVSIHHHIQYGEMHSIDTGYEYTWRQHAIHWGEPIASGKWEVWGYHYLKGFHDRTPFDSTYADDCRIIDGW